ncbi:NlpC/P60 family protein [Streptomyces sp. NPDC005576]|uniref:NlpC/P60 family protein n=1 Tax=Streptomyces sp. NPDC005576 TaxID=3364726 RepID=UPI0036876E5D
MSTTSRRTVLAALAGAAAVPLGATSAAASPPSTVPATSSAASASLGSPRSSVTLGPIDPAYFTDVSLGTLTTAVVPGTPERLEVTSGSRRIAVLTRGARTVVLAGPRRTFTENKQPFADDFRRTLPDPDLPVADRAYWGTSPAGGSWSTLGPVDTDYSVVPGSAAIALTTDYASRHATLRDDGITDVDVRSTAGFDKVPTGQACSYALSFGYQDTHNNYRARLSFLTTGTVELRVEKEVADTVTQLTAATTLATGVPAGTEWTVRVRREGARIQVKAWRTDTAEPAAWAADVTDTTFAKGRVGLRALANQGCANLPVTLVVSRFQVDAATWQQPPTVTHDSWVRVLTAPFDGNWTSALEQTVRRWAGSPAPDVLSHAAAFLPGAPRVTTSATPATGSQVMGEAGYGYLDPRGYRYEGADFHEYMGIGWTFPDGTSTGPSTRQAGNLDCSGYTRMVYGYHMGVPVAAGEDTSRTRIPRQSRHMADYTPGTRIDRTDGTNPPAAEQLQPGDLLLFNADSGDDTVTATVDHVGIYLGPDSAGKRRFLSSRKTGNGPTMSDLGGASLLDGTGTYATALHTVHRI